MPKIFRFGFRFSVWRIFIFWDFQQKIISEKISFLLLKTYLPAQTQYDEMVEMVYPFIQKWRDSNFSLWVHFEEH